LFILYLFDDSSITNSKIYSENSENEFMDKSGSTVDTDLKTDDTIERFELESVDKENQKTFIECVESGTLENESSNKYNINKKKKTSDLQKKNQSAISKITVIFMIITTVFLICSNILFVFTRFSSNIVSYLSPF
jgi:hypothetical protein